jgi:hypothetical protein
MATRVTAASAVIAIALTAVASGSPRATSAHYWKRCGRPAVAVVGQVKAHNVGCWRANAVVKGFFRISQSGSQNIQIDNFSCTGGLAGSYMTVDCIRGAQRAYFKGGLG